MKGRSRSRRRSLRLVLGRARGRKATPRRRWLWRGVRVALLLAVFAVLYSVYVYVEITGRLDGRVWDVPARIYSSSRLLVPGGTVDRRSIVDRLDLAGYREVRKPPERPGEYRTTSRGLHLFRRRSDSPAESGPPVLADLRFRTGRLIDIRGADGKRLRSLSLEPLELGTLYGSRQEDRDPLRRDELPEPLVGSVLAAEDARFHDHLGIDPRAVVRAALANARRGRIVQGGSTITQQTVKNLYLDQRRTWWRKAREAWMALVLDAAYSKDRILEVYLNEVYLGQRGSVAICGMQSAARHYFGRELSDLTRGEWALLAGMIRSPGQYNPFRHPEAAVERRNQVLDALVRLGQLDEAEADRARAEALRLAPEPVSESSSPFGLDAVRARLQELLPPAALAGAGLRVYTTLDPLAQAAAEQAVRQGLDRLDPEGHLEGAIVVTRPETGDVLAVVGGRDYRTSQFNRAFRARRQPGSAFKPFVYAAAFEAARDEPDRGLTPASLLDDAPLELVSGGRPWRPLNYDGEFRGPVSARRALEESLNVPTVRAAHRVGLDQVARLASDCGLGTTLRELPSMALGAQEVTPVGLAAAYGTLANGGIHRSLRILDAVLDDRGELLHREVSPPRRAVTAEAAYLVTEILQGVMTQGTGRSAAAHGVHGTVAGKTGTSDDHRDAWFVGYSPELLALVWVGYDDNSRTRFSGASGALPIWADFMRRVGEHDSYETFPRPGGIVRTWIDPETGDLALRGCPRYVRESFIAGTEPQDVCSRHGRRRWWQRWLRGRDI